MGVANLTRQVRRFEAQGYPMDGSKPLSPRLERLCGLLAGEGHTNRSIAGLLRVGHATIERVKRHPIIRARVVFLRDKIAAEAYEAEPLVDKRNRVVAAARLARTLHETLERNEYEDVIAVTKQGVAIKAHDRWRVQHYLDAFAAVHRMVDGPGTTSTTSTTTVNVGISMEDAAARVQALFSRLPDAIEGEVIPDASFEGGAAGVPP